MLNPTLLDLSFDQLAARIGQLGAPSYRTQQIWHGVFSDLARSYAEITTLPTPLREALARTLPWPTLDPVTTESSSNALTSKTLFGLIDGETIESVMMTYPDRRTVCVSSQVGCAIGCPMCATGDGGLVRNLSAGEIVGQCLFAARHFAKQDQRLTHVVYMGMGEPLLNIDATLDSIRILNDPRGLELGARSFTVSTAGIVPGIDRLSRELPQVNLAISLHAANDRLRDRLVPANRRYPLRELFAACRRHMERTHRRVTFEIALIAGVNDSIQHAEETANLLRGSLCHVNLIPLNPTESTAWRAGSRESLDAFAGVLSRAGIPNSVRASRGREIQAGCGQLRSRRSNDPRAAEANGEKQQA